MKRILFVLPALLLTTNLKAELHIFTDVEGRKISAEIETADDTGVSVKLKDGRKARIANDRLSPPDVTYVTEWRAAQAKAEKQKAKAEASAKRAAEIPVKIVAFCKANHGKQVGNGECWTLANEAFKACGLKRPGKDLRVWGRLLDLKKEKPQPGDIVEYRSAKFRDGSMTGPEHTSVVIKGGKRGAITIAEQNWGGNKTVRETLLDPGSLVRGEIMIYRPE